MPKKSKNSVIKSFFRPEQRPLSAPVRHNQHVQNMNRPRKSNEAKPKPKKKHQQRKHSAPEKKTAVSHKRDFRLELPKNLPNSNQQVPWLANKVLPVANASSSSKKTSSSRKAQCHEYLKVPLPCQHKQMDFFELLSRIFSNYVRQALDHEICALAAYVQLNEREHDARHDWLKQVTRIVQATFSCKDAHLQVYGSFATPGVCSFCSDIDTALWGVVPTTSLEPVAAPARMAQESIQRKRAATDQDSNAAPLTKQARRDFVKVQPVQSKEKYQKWLEALDSVDPVDETFATTAAASSTMNEAGANKSTAAYSVKGERNASSMETAMCVMADGTIVNYDLTGDSSSSSSKSSTGSMSEPKIEKGLEPLSSNQPPVHAVTETDSETSSDLSDTDFVDKLANFAESKLDAVKARLPSVRHAPRGRRAIIDSDLDDSDDSGGKNHPITLSCSDSENDDDDDEDRNMHVSYIARGAPTFTSRPFFDPCRMSRDTKDACVSALAKLANRLRKAPQARRVDLIKKARVPIIKMVSNLGFEADVAIGGHNGSDTSAYAAAQVNKYKSFGPVILLLKTILWQQKLDTPYHGGLGSYKLYVLVAFHLEKHLSLGGRDDPGEVFLSFLYRYGGLNSRSATYTRLSQHSPLRTSSGDAEADLSNVFLLDNCVDLFASCYMRVYSRLAQLRHEEMRIDRHTRQTQAPDMKCSSTLAVVISCANLSTARDEYSRKTRHSV